MRLIIHAKLTIIKKNVCSVLKVLVYPIIFVVSITCIMKFMEKTQHLLLHFQILRINPNTGKVLQTLKLPSLQITSAVFGGPNLEDLYITSAKVAFTKEMEEKYPLAGSTFRVTGLGVKGTPSVPVVLWVHRGSCPGGFRVQIFL